MKQIREYPCPHCEDEIEVDGNETSRTCKSCGQIYHVNYDAEFVDGMWRDLTKLTL